MLQIGLIFVGMMFCACLGFIVGSLMASGMITDLEHEIDILKHQNEQENKITSAREKFEKMI